MKRFIILQNMRIEGPGLFSKIARNKGFKIEIIRLDLGDKLPNLNTGDILLILGGSMGIKDVGKDKYPWLEKEVKLIKSILNKDIGIIGVCLGAQLLSYAAGGDTELLKSGTPLRPNPEIGWDEIYSVDYQSEDEISMILKKPIKVLHWHEDRILLPNSAELNASSCRCKEQLFRIGSLAYGLQFHVEIDDQMIDTWISEDQKFISSALGADGQTILNQQQKEFGHKTLVTRLEFLNNLFDLLS